MKLVQRIAQCFKGTRPPNDMRKCRPVLKSLLDGYRGTALLYVAAKLGLADLLADGPKSSAELAQELGAHAAALQRILRGLVLLGVCSEEPDGRFGLTALGSWLRSDVPGSLRGLAILSGEECIGAWGGLAQSALTGETAFNHVFGISQWEHRQQHPELNEYFNAWLGQSTAGATGAVLAAYDFAAFKTVVDIGGGQGALLAALLQAHPTLSGILFDQPHVIDAAQAQLAAAGVAARCQVVGGSFFEQVPAGGDGYLLKSVIHDWDDEQSVTILKNCHRALGERGKLLLVERVMPVRAEDDPSTVWVDLHMLALTGGRERSEADYRALLAAAGFVLTRVIPTRSGFSILEGVPAAAK